MALTLRIVALVATFILKADAQDNSAPVMYLQRHWVIRETEPVGFIVGRAQAEDNEDDELTYGLEMNSYKPHKPLPFAIDKATGTVYLNETLQGRAGDTITLHVTVSDGQLTTKSEVQVQISSAAGGIRPAQTRPFFSGNPSSVKIPGVSANLPFRPILHHFATVPTPMLSGPVPASRAPDQTSTTTTTTTTSSEAPEGMIANSTSETPTVAIEVEGPPLSSKVAPSEAPPNQSVAVILGLVVFGCAVLLTAIALIWSFKNRKDHGSVSVTNLSSDPSHIIKRWHGVKIFGSRYEEWEKYVKDAARLRLRDDKFEFPRHRLKVFNILGEGCFGQVWRCEAMDINSMPGPTIVAVKTLKENSGERERLDLAQELKVMKNLEPHPHVVRLLGCCTDREPIFVIMEYVSGGKLQSFLRASREERSQGGPGLTSTDLTGFVYQIAKGMEYLTSKGIIHRDLAARNVLIDENRKCKVADFGFARDLAANQVYERKSQGRLPIRWMAPESLYDNIFSVKSDIWSFGVLIWEIVTLGSTPYPGMAAAEVMKRIKEGYRLDRPEHCKRELYNIMYYCWDKDPACRPSFCELVNLSEGLLKDETDYIELDRFPDHSYYNVLNLSGEKL